MIHIVWKYLFEVQLLHEYYLSGNLEDDFFALPDAQRAARLRNMLQNRTYNIWHDLDIVPTEETEKILKRYQLRFIKTRSGFFIGIQVKPVEPGITEFLPFIPITQPLELNFRICLINRSFSTITNMKQRKILPAIFHFNNYSETENRQVPVLSVPVTGFIEGRYYEMGEMALFYNEIKQAIIPTTNGNMENWKIVSSAGHVNEGDRCILPHTFTCSVPESQAITKLDFSLKSLTGETLKSYSFSETDPITRIYLDFSTSESDSTGSLKDGFYDLEMIINDSLRQVKRILISSKLFNKCCLGIISINTGIEASLFKIFKTNGTLDYTKDNYNNTQHPLFEIRFKNRLSYWCYFSKNNKELFTTDQTDRYLNKVGDHLQTKDPLPLKAAASEFSAYNETLGQEEHIFLPNPYPAALRIDQNGFIYTHIYTSKIDGLIEET